MKIVADTSPLIAFAILQKLDLLAEIFDEIWLPTAVYQEAVTPDKPHYQAIEQFAKIRVKPVQNHLAVHREYLGKTAVLHNFGEGVLWGNGRLT